MSRRSDRARGRLQAAEKADAPGQQVFGGFAIPDTWHRLRIRLDDKEVVAESTHDGRWWEAVYTAPRSRFPGAPTAVRIGKMSPGAQNEDYQVPGPAGTCAIRRLKVFGGKP